MAAPQVVSNNPNASAASVVGAFVTVVAVLVQDVGGYTPSSAAFWPGVVTVLSALALFVGRVGPFKP